MRVLIDVDPVDLPEVPQLLHGIPLIFGSGEDRHIHHAIVCGIEYLPDGRMRLACELVAQLPTWDYDGRTPVGSSG